MKTTTAQKKEKLANEILTEAIPYYLKQERKGWLNTLAQNLRRNENIEKGSLLENGLFKITLSNEISLEIDPREQALLYTLQSDLIEVLHQEKQYFLPLLLEFCNLLDHPYELLLIHNPVDNSQSIHPLDYSDAFEILIANATTEIAHQALLSLINMISQLNVLEGTSTQKELLIGRLLLTAHEIHRGEVVTLNTL